MCVCVQFALEKLLLALTDGGRPEENVEHFREVDVDRVILDRAQCVRDALAAR